MNALAHWLTSGLLYGTALFALATIVSATALKHAHPAARALMFGLVLLKFAVPFGAAISWPEAAPTSAVMALTVSVVPSATSTRTIPWQELLLLVWAAGVLSIALRRFFKHHALLRALGTPEEPSPRVQELASLLGVRAPRVVHHASGPSLVGVWRPVLALPPGASGEALDAMVVHELMHLRRRDLLWRLLQAVVETLFFFWPVVRVASRQLSLAREEACDLAVVESGLIGRARYAEVLLQLGLESSPSLAMAAQPSHLERRIEMVLSGKKLRPKWLVVVVLAIAGLAGASASVWSAPGPTDQTPTYFSQPAPVRLSTKGGAIDERVLATQLITDRASFDGCYLEYLADHPGVSGTVLLHFTVKTDGSVSGTCQEEGTTLPIEVGRCISERLELMNLTRPLGVENVELQYRFDFVAPPSAAQPSGTPT